MPDFGGVNGIEAILAAGSALFALAYVRRARRQQGPSPWAHIVFLIALCAQLTALFAPALFQRTAGLLVEETGLPEFTREADRRVATLEQLPQVVWDTVKGPFADLLDEEPPTPEFPSESLSEPGALEGVIVPVVQGLVAFVLRVAVFGIGVIALTAAFLLRTTRSQDTDLETLHERVEALEARLETGVEAGAS